MNAHCYILFSECLNRYYTGSTTLNSEDRLELHLKKKYGKSKYTSKADDWILYISIECLNIEQARRIETFIKKQKSAHYIRSLKVESRKNWLLENI